MNQRDTTLDLAKGLLIILMVLGHSIQYSFGADWHTSQLFFENIVFKTIYSFHMPLFMLISGYLFYNSNQRNFKSLLLSKLKVIGIPMLSFILLFNKLQYLIMLIHGNVLGIIRHYILTIISGMTMWFLFSLLLNMVIIAVLTRLFKNKSLSYIGMFIIFVMSFFIPDFIVLSVYKFMFPFFCIGYAIKQNDISLYACSYSKVRLGIITVLSVLAIWWFNKDTYIYTSGFCALGESSHQFLIDCKRMIIGLMVSYMFMQYIKRFVHYSNPITNMIIKFGQMSLFFYGMNIVFNHYYSLLLSTLSVNFEFNYLIPLLLTVVFVLICYYLYVSFAKNKFTRIAFLGK